MKFLKIYILVCSIVLHESLQPICIPGQFQQVPGSPFPAGSGPNAIAFSPITSGNLFAATVNSSGNNASVYLINQITGFFTLVDTPTTGTQPFDVAFSPIVSGNLFASITNFSDNTVSVYEVNQITGAFTSVSGSPFATGGSPAGIAFSPIVSGNLFAAIANNASNNVSVYQVNQTTGAFTLVSGAPFGTGLFPTKIAFSPVASGNLFAAVASGSDITVYQVNQTTGFFTNVSTVLTGLGTNSIAFSPIISGNLFAAVTNSATNNILVYEVNQTTGAFTAVPGSPFSPLGTFPFDVAFSPIISGNLFASVVNSNSNNVSVYQVNPINGVFSYVTGSPFSTGQGPAGIAFSPGESGNLFAAAANNISNNISGYKVCLPLAPILGLLLYNDCTAHTITGTALADGFRSIGNFVQATHCYAYECDNNGFTYDATNQVSLEYCQAAYNGVGFLVTSTQSVIGNCVAFANDAVGFDVTGSATIYYCFASQNDVNNYVNAGNLQNADTQIDNTVVGLTGPFAGANLFM